MRKFLLQGKNPISNDELLIVILAGGQGRRLGFKNKPLLQLGEKRIIDRIVGRLKIDHKNILINANADTLTYSQLNLPTVPDSIADFSGPLAGILTGMQWAAENNPKITHVITIAGDTPFFPNDYVSECLAKKHETSCDIVMASSQNRVHPVFGLWPIHLKNDLEIFMTKGIYKVLAFSDQYDTQKINFEKTELEGLKFDPFFNINNKEDLEYANIIISKYQELGDLDD